MNEELFPMLRFDYPFSDEIATEAEERGYWGYSHVELEDGSKYPVVFYDAVRLTQDLKEETTQGRPFIAEKGMIVLESVTIENMRVAISRLKLEGFFS